MDWIFDTWDSLVIWFGTHWHSIVLIIAGAYIAKHFGYLAMRKIIIRTVKHRAHGDMSDDDIRKRQDTLISMFSAVLHVMIWLVAGFSLLRLVFEELDLTPILASASVLGVAIGFGAQTVIKDFLTGMLIILENQYRVGDIIEVDGASGTVEQITIRSTVMRDTDGAVHYIPNGTIAHVVNKTMGFSKINLSIAVTATTSIDEAAAAINQVGERLATDEKWKSKIIEAPRFLSIGTFTEEALELKVIGKTQPAAQWTVTAELRRRLFATFKKQKIELTDLPSTGSITVENKKK